MGAEPRTTTTSLGWAWEEFHRSKRSIDLSAAVRLDGETIKRAKVA